MIRFQQRQALTSHFESFWSIVQGAVTLISIIKLTFVRSKGVDTNWVGLSAEMSPFSCIHGLTITKLFTLVMVWNIGEKKGKKMFLVQKSFCLLLDHKTVNLAIILHFFIIFSTDLGSLIGNTQCQNFRIFVLLRFYVKSILVILKQQKLPFWWFEQLWILNLWKLLTFQV